MLPLLPILPLLKRMLWLPCYHSYHGYKCHHLLSGYQLYDVYRSYICKKFDSNPECAERLWGPSSLVFNGSRGCFTGDKSVGAWGQPLTSNLVQNLRMMRDRPSLSYMPSWLVPRHVYLSPVQKLLWLYLLPSLQGAGVFRPEDISPFKPYEIWDHICGRHYN